MDIGARLQLVRKSKDLSQRELAKRVGVTNSTISLIEQNKVSPSVSSLKKVLDGMKPGEVLMLASNCPGTPADIEAWVNNTPLELVDRIEVARGAFEFYLRKK